MFTEAQIKLENVRAKNVQGNVHTLRFLLLSINVSKILRTQVYEAKEAMISESPRQDLLESGPVFKAGMEPGPGCALTAKVAKKQAPRS